jgi:lipopolysaccharide biosynthesis glycosyltransferase
MTKPRAIIVSASDDQYMTLAHDLFASIRAQTFDVEFDLGMLDVGLGDASKQTLAALDVKTVKVKSDIEYPGRENWEKAKPGFRTLTGRLFMREYFPGYDVYMWMDADVWVQTPDAINTMIASAAKSNAMHLACELDRCYKTFFDSAAIWHIFRDWYTSNYGEQISGAMALKPMLNAGVWAMAKDAPMWSEWIQIYTEALHRLTEATDKSFMADQLGLNILCYLKKIPHVLMPANFNWITFYALPMFDKEKGLYVEPAPPYRPISQFHLTRPIKIQSEKMLCTDGTEVERPLTFSAWKK